MTIWFASHAAACVAFLVFAGMLAASSRARGMALSLLTASIATSAWGAALAVAPVLQLGGLVLAAEALRAAGWMVLLFHVLIKVHGRSSTTIALAAAAAGLVTLGAAMPLLARFLPVDATRWAVPTIYLGLATIGIVVLENLMRNADEHARWRLKFLCIAVGGLLGYDLALYADGLLFGRFSQFLTEPRGAVNAIAVPLLAIAAARNRDWEVSLHVSRRFVFHTAAMIGIGGYLLLMASAGYYIRKVGGSWGSLLQISFVFGMFLVLALVLFSGSARSLLRLWINKHFYSYRYDYREEWLRSIRTLSSATSSENLQRRIVRAVADVVDSPGGVLWLRDKTGAFVPAEYWNVPRFSTLAGTELPGSAFLARFKGGEWIVELGQSEDPAGAAQPNWLENMLRPWIAVPLCHLDQMVGFVALEYPRVPLSLMWEHYDLLRTVGRHAASYLAEEQATRALLESQEFTTFNKKFAFVVHDIKNVVSQLSLILRNHERHGSNPEFQRDLIETVHHSVGRMNKLLQQLSGELRRTGRNELVAPAALIREIVSNFPQDARMSVNVEAGAGHIEADPDRIRAALEHVLQNAREAAGPDGRVSVTARHWQRSLLIEVADDGPGMTPEFIRTELFRPFVSTKKSGFGIGAYQTREIVRQAGGELHVESMPGEGTTVRIILPLAEVRSGETSLAGTTA